MTRTMLPLRFPVYRLAVGACLLLGLTACVSTVKNKAPAFSSPAFTVEDIRDAQKIIGLQFTPVELDTLYGNLQRNLEGYEALRKHPLPNEVAPALYFDPRPAGFELPAGQREIDWSLTNDISLPAKDQDLAFYSVADLSVLIRSRQLTSEQLTRLYLDRLKKYDPQLKAVVTLTEELALRQARHADQEIAAGRYRGPLHGIPYGLKDLAAVPGYPTTWGAAPYREQRIEETAAIVRRLEEAGAVLVAKLTTGELAYGDYWFGGRTLNPWDPEQGARGSSAGPAAATAAGLVAFSIGTETWGSIISPATRCGATGLRPTFGRVSRHGVMTLSWSLDKVGPICRTALDAALVFEVIRGADARDRSTVDAPFNFDPDPDLSALRVGYLKEALDQDTSIWGKNNRAALAAFQALGLSVEPVSLPGELPWGSVISTIIRGESGAAFDALVLDNQDDELARQNPGSRANSLRQSRFIPAVEYLQANRYRQLLIGEMHELMARYDLLIAPTFGDDQSAITNLTGHPVVCVPDGWDGKGRPTSITLIGRLYDEATILAVAHRFQQVTDFDEQHPKLFME